MANDDLFFATISELNAKLKTREISAVELAKLFSQRLETLGPRYNAVALPLTKDALKKAKEVDADIKRERFRSPLQGIPYGAKDLLSYAKFPTTWGAKPYAAQVFDYTATALTKLEKGGALLMGKLAMVELAGGGGYRTAGASMFGPGLNPWNRDYWSGGSSSGSGSAVAAGLVTFALGSETSGSILTPSAYCGITGLRPTYGLVSRHGAMPLAWTLDKIGPMCRSAADCGLVLDVIAGGGTANKSFYYTPEYHRDFKSLRIGYAPADSQAVSPLRDMGLNLVETKLPDFPYGALVTTIYQAEGASVFEPLITSGKIDELADPAQAAGFRAALQIPAKDYLRAQRVRTLVQEAFHKLFADLDAIAAPTRYGPATKITEPVNTPGPPLIPAGNLAGLPAISFPSGFTNGLPVALQLCGPPFSENQLISIAAEYQTHTDFHRRRPPSA